ncbi:MAG: ABC transporter substrate-binding protein [Chthoniobacteraceae bacterium]
MKTKFLLHTLAALAAGLQFAAVLYADEVVRVGHLPVTGHAKFFIAKEEGFFKEEGLDVQLVEFANSADGLAALRGGKLDLGAFGTTAPLLHISKGAEIRIIGGVMGEDAAIITTPEKAASVQKITDLKGKKLATVRLATGDAVVRGALDAVGVDWKKDVQIFELKNPPAVLEAVKSGQVDAGLIWGPFDFKAEEQGLKVTIRSHSLQPGHPCCRLTINAKDAEARPEVWVKFIHAFLKAEKFAQDNHEKTLDDIQKYLKLDRPLIEKAYYDGYLDQSSDPNVDGVVFFWKTMLKSGFAESNLDVRNFITTKFYEQALTQLAKEQPNEPFWQQRLKTFTDRDNLAKPLAWTKGDEGWVKVAAAKVQTECCHQ